MEISAGIIGIILTVIIQTIAIGYFIGSIKTVVERLVKDVECFGDEIRIAIDGITGAKRDIADVNKEVARNQGRIESIENRINQMEQRALS